MTDQDWIGSLFAAIDAKDTPRFLTFLTSDCSLRFGNAPAVAGADAIGQTIEGFFASIAGLSHQIVEAWSVDDRTIIHGQVTYTTKDASSLTMPFADILRLRDGRICEYLVFTDVSELG